MFVEFEKMPLSSRIWIYQCDRKLGQKEENQIAYHLKNSISEWRAHQVDLKGSFKIENQFFVIIALDESVHEASGCSIDATTKWLKDLGAELTINFFDRSIAYLDEEEEIKTIPIFGAKKAILENITKDTLVCNTTALTISELVNKRFFKAEEVAHIAKYLDV